jgi:hypothetical protein
VQPSDVAYQIPLLHSGLYENNEAAIQAARKLKLNSPFADLLILSADGTIVWDIPELNNECGKCD